jgi:DNA polymerase IIIc chi subunit
MKHKVYISPETFTTLTSILQKGLQQGLNFYIYDEADQIQNRLWTFSQSAFMPNVKSNDDLLKTTQVPIVISTQAQQPLEHYKPVIYQSISGFVDVKEAIIIVEAKHDLDKILNTLQIAAEACEIYIKNQNSWGKVLV